MQETEILETFHFDANGKPYIILLRLCIMSLHSLQSIRRQKTKQLYKLTN
jgi:hypothetical protein